MWLQYHMTITVRTASMMILTAWLAPTAISFLPIFLGWYTTNEYLQHRDFHPDQCRFIVNKASNSCINVRLSGFEIKVQALV